MLREKYSAAGFDKLADFKRLLLFEANAADDFKHTRKATALYMSTPIGFIAKVFINVVFSNISN